MFQNFLLQKPQCHHFTKTANKKFSKTANNKASFTRTVNITAFSHSLKLVQHFSMVLFTPNVKNIKGVARKNDDFDATFKLTLSPCVPVLCSQGYLRVYSHQAAVLASAFSLTMVIMDSHDPFPNVNADAHTKCEHILSFLYTYCLRLRLRQI